VRLPGAHNPLFQHTIAADGNFSPDGGGPRLLDCQIMYSLRHVCGTGLEEIRYSTIITSCSPSFNAHAPSGGPPPPARRAAATARRDFPQILPISFDTQPPGSLLDGA